MIIKQAGKDQYEQIRLFYHSLIDAMESRKCGPAKAMVRFAIDKAAEEVI